MPRPLLLLLLLASATLASSALADEEQGPRWSLAVGGGYGYDLAGLKLELRSGHWAGFFSTGPFALPKSSSDAYGNHQRPLFGFSAAGLRWYRNVDGQGLFLSLYAALDLDRVSASFLPGGLTEYTVHAAGTVGYRLQLGRVFFEGDVGPIVHFGHQSFASESGQSTVAHDTTSVGLLYDDGFSDTTYWFVPAVDIGIGISF